MMAQLPSDLFQKGVKLSSSDIQVIENLPAHYAKAAEPIEVLNHWH